MKSNYGEKQEYVSKGLAYVNTLNANVVRCGVVLLRGRLLLCPPFNSFSYTSYEARMIRNPNLSYVSN